MRARAPRVLLLAGLRLKEPCVAKVRRERLKLRDAISSTPGKRALGIMVNG